MRKLKRMLFWCIMSNNQFSPKLHWASLSFIVRTMKHFSKHLLLCSRRKQILQVRNDMRVYKWCQNFHFLWAILFPISGKVCLETCKATNHIYCIFVPFRNSTSIISLHEKTHLSNCTAVLVCQRLYWGKKNNKKLAQGCKNFVISLKIIRTSKVI